MKDHSRCKRQFIQLSKAWYGDTKLQESDIIDKITIGFYNEDGGTTGEFVIKWTLICGAATPMICSFDDSWSALLEFKDLLEKLAELDNLSPSPDEIVKVLISLGIENNTKEMIKIPLTNLYRCGM